MRVTMRPGSAPFWRWLAAWAGAYFVFGAFGLNWLLHAVEVAPVVLTSGLFFAAMLLTPPSSRLWLAIALAATDVAVEQIFDFWGVLPHAAIALTLAAEAWLSVFVAEQIGGPDVAALRRLRDVGSIVGGAAAGTLLGAVPGALIQIWMDGLPFATGFLQWWAPDFVAYTVFAPALLSAVTAVSVPAPPLRGGRLEFLAVFALTCLGTWYAHAGWAHIGGPRPPLAVAVLPLLGWAAVRFGAVGTTWLTLLVGTISVAYTFDGQGTYSSITTSLVGQLIWTQVFTVTVGLSMLALAVALSEREASVTAADSALDEARRGAERFRAFFEGTSEMLAVADRELRLVMCTSAWMQNCAQLFGTAPSLGMRLDEGELGGSRQASRDVGDAWRRAVRGDRVSLAQRVARRDGTEAEIERLFVPLRDAIGEIIGATESVRDVAEIRQRQQQEARGRRLEMIGRLAGGVAHDFNNIVSVILGYADVVLHRLPEGDARRADLVEIVRAGERAARLTGQLLSYARRQVIEPRVVDVPTLLSGLAPMLDRLLGEHITTRWALAADTEPVRVDPGQLEQVVVNLAVNARDAMPEGGQLTIECANARLGKSDVRSLAPGPYVMIAVSDTGAGMAPDVRERVFEPFFTTKGTGRGTGLGLATAEGIVNQAGGAIAVYSEVGAGSSFKVYLPPSPVRAAEPAPEPVRTAEPGGSERILLLEDDEAVRHLAARVLRERGYAVIEAGSARDAEALPDHELQSCSLLLSDVVLPDDNGAVAAERLRARHPTLRVLFMSGYAEQAVVQHGLVPHGVHLLAKPFAPEALLRRVRAVLTER